MNSPLHPSIASLTPVIPRWRPRLLALLLALPAAGLLAVALYLTPDPSGIGTHTELGLAPCAWLGTTGLPCATCGMTTATSLAAHGRLIHALVTQPAAALLALACAMHLLLCAYAVATGADILTPLRRLPRPRTLVIVGLVVLAAWIYTLSLTLMRTNP
ncbi:MAG: DUF2752 domain-containing protein [Phycisphaeraceae bacterium]|nr:DUF2752 domain-containing protein [Phycisphaeraceae bacterium]